MNCPSPESKVSISDRKKTIDDFLKKGRNELIAFLGSPPPVWKPRTNHAATLKFYEQLAIPDFNGMPWLSLHNLGAKRNPYVDSVFGGNPENRILCNTTGAGKTAVLLEGLCKNWGFYFDAVQDGRIGSHDLNDVIVNMAKHPGWVDDVFAFNGNENAFRAAIRANEAIASKWICKTLLARWYIFRLFIDTAREMYNGDLPHDIKRSWLLLQLKKHSAIEGNLFQRFMSECLGGIDEIELASELKQFDPVMILGRAFDPAKPFFCVLDDAQYAARIHSDAFVAPDGKTPRPVLWPILITWQEWFKHINARFIVSGTGFSIKLFTELATSSFGKSQSDRFWEKLYNVGDFDDEIKQRTYVKSYLPPDFLRSPSGSLLVTRMYKWLRGRHQFTVFFLEYLLNRTWTSNGPEAPHRLLDVYLAECTGIELENDSGSAIFSKDEPEVLKMCFFTFDWDRLLEDVDTARALSGAVWNFLTSGKIENWDKLKNEIVEYGFARFVDNDATVYIREPLVLAAVLSWFEKKGYSLANNIRVEHDSAQGTAFERTLTISLSKIFRDYAALSDVFDFYGTTPRWAMQKARITRRARSRFAAYDDSPYDPESGSCFAATSPEEVKEWLTSGTSMFCVPGNLMGPDLLTRLELEDGRVFLLLVEAKCLTEVTSEAIDSLNPRYFFHSRVCRCEPNLVLEGLTYPQKKAGNEVAVASMLDSINTGPVPFIGPDYDILRVIAAYPKAGAIDPERLYHVERAVEADAHPFAVMKSQPFLVSLATYEHSSQAEDSPAENSLSDMPALKKRRRDDGNEEDRKKRPSRHR